MIFLLLVPLILLGSALLVTLLAICRAASDGDDYLNTQTNSETP